MKNLIEIARIVSRKKLRKIEILDSATLESGSSKFAEFYDAMMAEKFKNDRDAATHLYNCSPTDDKYRQLKSRFKKRLMNSLFFLDIPSSDAGGYGKAYFSTSKDWALVKILIANEAFGAAEELTKQILTVALRYRFADVIVNCARTLRQFSMESGDEKAFEEYDRLLKQYASVLEAESRSEELFQRMVLSYRKDKSQVPGIGEQMQGYCDALVGLSEIFDSPVVIYNMYLVWAYRFEIQHDYPAMLQVCQQAEQYIDKNPNFLQEDKLIAFQLKKMSAYLHLRDFKNGKINAERALQLFGEGSEGWFTFMEYYLLLAFHTDNHVNALAIYNRAKANPKFKRLGLEAKEKWKVFEIYLIYFIENQPEEMEALKAQAKKSFKLDRFLNDSLYLPRELRVITIHLLISQVLFLLGRNAFPEMNERIERLKNAAAKQLDPVDNFRMIQFIRLLVQLSKANYLISEMQGSEKYYERLVEQPFFYRGLLNELELMPFEKLWNHILAKLEQ